MSENRSKKPQALKEFFSLQDEYDQKELTAEEEKEFEFHRCGGVLFGSLSDLRVDVSEEIDTFAEMEKIASAILELIQKSCVKGIKGITHFISTHIKVDKKESENVWVVDCGILRPAKDSDDLGQQIVFRSTPVRKSGKQLQHTCMSILKKHVVQQLERQSTHIDQL